MDSLNSTTRGNLIPIAGRRVLARDEILRVMLTHPRPRAVVVTCYLIALAWIELLAFSVFFVLSAMNNSSIFESLSIITLLIFVVTVCCYLILALRLYCPSCNRRFLLQTLGPKHPLARKILGMDYWATNAIDVIMHAEFIPVCSVVRNAMSKSHRVGDYDGGAQKGSGVFV